MAVNVTVETLLRQAASPHQQPTAMSHVWATLRRSVVRVTDLTYMSRMEPLSQPSQQAALPPLALPLQYLRPLVCQPAGCPTDVTEKAPLDVLFRINSQIAKPTLLRFASIPARTSAIRSLVWNMALNGKLSIIQCENSTNILSFCDNFLYNGAASVAATSCNMACPGNPSPI